MDALSATKPGYSFPRFQENANRLLEAQLDLAESQVAEQSLTELEASLVLVDKAINWAALFAVVRLSMTESVGVDSSTPNTSSQREIDLVSRLLKREKLIIDRIRLLRSQCALKTMTEIIDSVTDQQLQERIRTDLEAARQVKVLDVVQIKTDYAFIAMSMDPENPHLEDLSDAIKVGSDRCGVIAERIDDAASNQPITVRMVNAIREAEFVIVLLTYARNNVYLEAGYALGIGKTPIFLAEVGTPIPFDLKDYPIIFYTNMCELRALLAERLTATKAAV